MTRPLRLRAIVLAGAALDLSQQGTRLGDALGGSELPGRLPYLFKQLSRHLLGEHPKLFCHVAGDRKQGVPGDSNGESLSGKSQRAATSPVCERQVRWLKAGGEV